MSFRFITWQGSRWLYTHSIWLYFKTSYVPISSMYLFTYYVYSYNIKHCYFVTQLCTFTDFTVYTHPTSLYIHIRYIRSFSPGAMLTRSHAWFQVQRGESIIGSRRRFHRFCSKVLVVSYHKLPLSSERDVNRIFWTKEFFVFVGR